MHHLSGDNAPSSAVKLHFLSGVCNGEGVHLQAVVVVEAQRLMLDHPLVQLEAGLLQTLFAAGMAAVQHGHVVLFRHFVDSSEQTYPTRTAAQDDAFAYLETFYNTIRPHFALGWLSSARFEAELATSAV